MAVMDYSWNSSYVYGVDNESGWGERYFFTYFSEFDNNAAGFIAAEVSVLAIIFLISVIANSVIVVCVFRYPEMHTVTNCFVLNLAMADLLFTLTIPAIVYTRIVTSWKLGDLACRLIPYVQFVSGIVLLWTLALISMDRYRCIVIPPYRSQMTPRQASHYAAAIWLSTAVLFVPVTLWFRVVTSLDRQTVCTLVFPRSDNVRLSACLAVPVVLVACLLPMAMLVYHYQRIFRKIISTKSTWASSCVVVSAADAKGCRRGRRQSELSISDIFVPWPRRCSGVPAAGRHGSLSQHEEIRLHRHVRVVRVLFLNVVVVLAMWLPITIVMLLIFVDGLRPADDRSFFLRSHHFVACLTVAFLNTLVNPVLYGALSDNFRTCLARMCCPAAVGRGAAGQGAATPTSGRINGASKTSRKPSFINSISENHNDVV